MFPFSVGYVSQEAAGTLVNRVIFTAPFDCVLNMVSETHTALGTDASAVNLQVEKLTSGQAPGAGAVLLANSSNAGFNLKGTINTPQFASWKAGASRRLKKGDRLATKSAGVLTAVAGVSLTFFFYRV
jgi:hypothetical protein